MDNLQKIYRGFKITAALDLYWALRDTRFWLIQILSDILSLASSYLFFLYLANIFTGLGDFTKKEVLFFLGFSALVHAFFYLFLADQNNGAISRIISRGQLDHFYLEPQPFWVQILTRGFAPVSSLLSFVFAYGLLGIALQGLGMLTLQNLMLLTFMGFCSILIIWSVIFMLSSVAFYAPAAAEEISIPVLDLFINTMIYPLGSFLRPERIILLTIVPIGWSAWYPAYLFLTEGNFAAVKLAGAASIFIILAFIIFGKGIGTYEKRGAVRYNSFGHR